jgi:putative ABC transport system permease protein
VDKSRGSDYTRHDNSSERGNHMNFFRRLKYLIPSICSREEREMNDEMEALSVIAAEEAAGDGVKLEEIGYASRRTLGNLTLAKENARAVWGWRWFEEFYKDFHYAFRVLRKQPGFLVVAVGSLALGIGANTAIFRVVNRLVVFESGNSFSYFAYTEFARYSGRALSEVFSLINDYRREVDTGGGPQRSNVELVTGNYFSALGISAQYGRTILPGDDIVTRPAYAAVISHASFGCRPRRDTYDKAYTIPE